MVIRCIVNPGYRVQITPVCNVSIGSCRGTGIGKEKKDLDHERKLTKSQLEVGAVLAKSGGIKATMKNKFAARIAYKQT